ncbi:MAG: efflux RND transporter periplasmic adaptor subunit, partial [Chloroflexota bacterium]
DLQEAQAKLDSAQNNYDSAVAKLEQLKNPTATDLASAEAAVSEAKARLASAQSKLDQFRAGSSEADLQTAQASVDQAKAALATAEGKLAELLAGPKESEIQSAKSSLANAQYNLAQKVNPPKELDLIQAEEAVRQSEANLQQAKDDLQNATLVAPFDGVVASIAANVGEQVGESTVMTIVDPMAIRIDVTVDETDVAKLAAGQPATITFDAVPGREMRGRVLSVPPTGTTQQGVVTYLISIEPELDGPPLPAGMTAVVTIEVERKDSVLLVPNRAVRTMGRNKVVDVMLGGGQIETRTVQIGSSNDQFTEIISGIHEGEPVVIPSTTIRSSLSPAGAVGGPPTKTNVVIR